MREHGDKIQVVGLGTQDDFAYARRFLAEGGLEGATMLWDPSFATWQTFGVTSNSQMMVLSADLSQSTDLIFGFDEAQRESILDLAAGL